MITVFTPTFNRVYNLPKLYESLKSQIFKDFEWLIVDDGSTDGTHDLVDEWMENSPFPIRYSYQTNGGKHRAINNGVKLAKGEWFFIVDSDDTLPDDSLTIANKWIETIKDNDSFAGACGLRKINGRVPDVKFEYLDISPLKIKHIIKTDKAEIFKTKILRNYPFPDFPGEKFCAESLVVNRMGQIYNIRYFNEVIYICEYLSDGLTKHVTENRRLSYHYTTLLYKEQMMYAPLVVDKIRAAINYWRFVKFTKNFKTIFKVPSWSFTMIPIGVIFRLKDYIILRF